MNKYDAKIIDLKKSADSIIEVMRTKKKNGVEKAIDFIFTGSLSALDGLNSNGAYFLVSEGEDSVLVNIDKNLEVKEYNVNKEVAESEGGKKFIFDGNYFKVYRVIK